MGAGMVHGVRLRDGVVQWYRTVARSLTWRPASANRDAGHTPRSALLGGSPNTNVIGHAGKTLAIEEGGYGIVELTDELETVGGCGFRRHTPRRLDRTSETRPANR